MCVCRINIVNFDDFMSVYETFLDEIGIFVASYGLFEGKLGIQQEYLQRGLQGTGSKGFVHYDSL